MCPGTSNLVFLYQLRAVERENSVSNETYFTIISMWCVVGFPKSLHHSGRLKTPLALWNTNTVRGKMLSTPRLRDQKVLQPSSDEPGTRQARRTARPMIMRTAKLLASEEPFDPSLAMLSSGKNKQQRKTESCYLWKHRVAMDTWDRSLALKSSCSTPNRNFTTQRGENDWYLKTSDKAPRPYQKHSNSSGCGVLQRNECLEGSYLPSDPSVSNIQSPKDEQRETSATQLRFTMNPALPVFPRL